ncbi:MAG TPA: hypothetical protein VNP96_00460 [Solirubrobacterales bacterium]|nr:hypothetical protein [Solirubrobacterales bacterium]
MARYVLMSQDESPQQADIDLIERSSGVTVVDRSARGLLVDAPDETVRELSAQLPNWTVANEVTYAPPEPQ